MGSDHLDHVTKMLSNVVIPQPPFSAMRLWVLTDGQMVSTDVCGGKGTDWLHVVRHE